MRNSKCNLIVVSPLKIPLRLTMRVCRVFSPSVYKENIYNVNITDTSKLTLMALIKNSRPGKGWEKFILPNRDMFLIFNQLLKIQ